MSKWTIRRPGESPVVVEAHHMKRNTTTGSFEFTDEKGNTVAFATALPGILVSQTDHERLRKSPVG